MRILAIDVGRRRTGVALSDSSATLASPLTTIAGSSGSDLIVPLVTLVERLRHDDDGLDALVVGLPRRLNGDLSDHAPFVLDVVATLRHTIDLPIHLQDERLTSHEADARLRTRERDWRKRKPKIDAAAAAVILQEFLDRRHSVRGAIDGTSVEEPS